MTDVSPVADHLERWVRFPPSLPPGAVMTRITGAIRWLTVAPLLIVVAACATTTGHSSVLIRPAATARVRLVEGRGFSALLPAGWTTQPAQETNGVISYQIGSGDAVWLGEIAVVANAGRVLPPGLTGDVLHEDIETLAFQVTGSQTGSTNVRTIEPMHLTNVVGESCAQLGVVSTYHGVSSSGLSVTCRHKGVIYEVIIQSSTAASPALDASVGAIEAGWRWS